MWLADILVKLTEHGVREKQGSSSVVISDLATLCILKPLLSSRRWENPYPLSADDGRQKILSWRPVNRDDLAKLLQTIPRALYPPCLSSTLGSEMMAAMQKIAIEIVIDEGTVKRETERIIATHFLRNLVNQLAAMRQSRARGEEGSRTTEDASELVERTPTAESTPSNQEKEEKRGGFYRIRARIVDPYRLRIA